MRVFKPTYKDKSGQKKELRKWWLELRDHLNIVRRFAAFTDKGQYYYLDRGQYNLLGGLGYSFGRSYYQKPYIWNPHQSVSISATPEPSTIVFLGLGALGVLGSKRYRKAR